MTTPTPGAASSATAAFGAGAPDNHDQPLVSVIIPAYNEAGTLEEVLQRVLEQPLRVELLVVDDGSGDETPALLERLEREGVRGLRVLRHEVNKGKSAAVRTGIQASTGSIVAIQDADLEYDPQDLPRLLAPIVEGHADVVYGTRLRGGQPQRAHLFWHYVGNRFLTLLTNVLYNTTISDMEVGYKAFKGDLIRSVPLVSRASASSPRSPPACSAAGTCACTRSRSPTTAAPTRRARRSPGATGSWPWRCSCASGSCASRGDVVTSPPPERRTWASPDLLAIAALTIVAIALRIPSLTQSLTLDEPHTYVMAHGSLGNVFSELRAGYEIHPPLYFALAWAASQLGDPADWVGSRPSCSGWPRCRSPTCWACAPWGARPRRSAPRCWP